MYEAGLVIADGLLMGEAEKYVVNLVIAPSNIAKFGR